jgi:hypothetical protein
MTDSHNEAMVLITLVHVYKIAPKVMKIWDHHKKCFNVEYLQARMDHFESIIGFW